MLRMVLINLAVVLAAALVGAEICRAIGTNPHPLELSLAVALAAVAGVVGAAPIAIRRRSAKDLTDIFQACFLGTVLHMAFAIAAAAVVILALHVAMAFVYWMLAMYWLSLTALVLAMIPVLRTPMTTAGSPGKAAA